MLADADACAFLGAEFRVATLSMGFVLCRSMLAEKLLTKTDYDCEREIRTLELLKLRFGDANLHNCEVRMRCFHQIPVHQQPNRKV